MNKTLKDFFILPAIFIASVGLISPVAFAEPHYTTLKQVVMHTLKSNPNVLITEKVRRAANETVREARAHYFPTLDAGAGYGRERNRNSTTRILGFGKNSLWRRESSITGNQMVFDGFATRYEVERTKARTVADAYNVWGTSEEVALRVLESYLNVGRNIRLVAIAKRNVAAHVRTYRMIKRRSEQGVGREADTNQALGRLALARSNLVASQNALLDAKTTYRRITDLKYRSLRMMGLPGSSFIPSTRQQAVSQAIHNHPLLKSAVADVEEAKAQHRASLSTLYPRIDFVLSGSNNRNIDGSPGPNDDILGMLRLQYNIFRGGADQARQRETAYLSQEAAEIRNRTYRQVIENIRLAYNEMVSERNRIPSLLQHQVTSKRTVVAYKKQFDLGKRTLLDLLDSENETFQAQRAYVNGLYDLKIAKFRVVQGKGQLLAYLSIRLPAEAHVPYKAQYVTDNLMLEPIYLRQAREHNTGEPRPSYLDYSVTPDTEVMPEDYLGRVTNMELPEGMFDLTKLADPHERHY